MNFPTTFPQGQNSDLPLKNLDILFDQSNVQKYKEGT